MDRSRVRFGSICGLSTALYCRTTRTIIHFILSKDWKGEDANVRTLFSCMWIDDTSGTCEEGVTINGIKYLSFIESVTGKEV
jgi:hypothetical protein